MGRLQHNVLPLPIYKEAVLCIGDKFAICPEWRNLPASAGKCAMDEIDWKILAELERDGRMSFADLGERVGLSKSPCWTRVRDLEAEGAIQGFGARINPLALGLAVQCHAFVRISFDAHAAFEAAAIAHPAIIE